MLPRVVPAATIAETLTFKRRLVFITGAAFSALPTHSAPILSVLPLNFDDEYVELGVISKTKENEGMLKCDCLEI